MSYPTNDPDYVPDDPEPTEAELAEQAENNSICISHELQELACALNFCDGGEASGVEIIYLTLDTIGDYVSIDRDALYAGWPELKAVHDRYVAENKAADERLAAERVARKAVQS
jgi:hypothetical protein